MLWWLSQTLFTQHKAFLAYTMRNQVMSLHNDLALAAFLQARWNCVSRTEHVCSLSQPQNMFKESKQPIWDLLLSNKLLISFLSGGAVGIVLFNFLSLPLQGLISKPSSVWMWKTSTLSSLMRWILSVYIMFWAYPVCSNWEVSQCESLSLHWHCNEWVNVVTTS